MNLYIHVRHVKLLKTPNIALKFAIYELSIVKVYRNFESIAQSTRGRERRSKNVEKSKRRTL